MGYGDSKYGELKYGSEPEKEVTVEEFKPDLTKYFPQFLCQNNTINTLIKELLPEELGKLKYSINDLINQYYIDDADWGLDLWEKLLGIPTDKLKPKEYRRSVIKAKIRGTGTVTKELIRQTASAYSGGAVEIIENPEDCSFKIKFIGVQGIPPNMMDLTKTIEEIKPAHLKFDYEYTYCIWDWTKKYDYSWNKIKRMSWNEAKTKIRDR